MRVLTSTIHLLLVPFALLLLVCSAQAYPIVDLVSNGDFESIPYSMPNPPCRSSRNGASFECDSGASSAISPWKIIRGRVDFESAICENGRCIDLNGAADDPAAALEYPLVLTPSQPYTLSFDMGGLRTSCGCMNSPALRRVQVTLTAVGDADPFFSTILSTSISGCSEYNRVKAQFTMPSNVSAASLVIASLMNNTNCGPVIDDVSLLWDPCISGVPPVAGDEFDVECADGWFVTPPTEAVPLQVTQPVTIEGPLSVTQLTIAISTEVANQADPTMVQVQGVTTVDGALQLYVPETVGDGYSITVINATEIVGSFANVTVTRPGPRGCSRSSIEQSDQCDGNGLKRWQIGLIVIGVILFVAAITVVVVLLVMKFVVKRKPTHWSVRRV